MAFKIYISLFIFLAAQKPINGQMQKDTGNTVTMPASEKYYKSKFYKSLWGEHYRKEWHTPVRFKITSLDTLTGGLVPYQTGGGRQSKTLRLRDKDQREYVLRSIDKSLGKALPEILRGTFIESFANDQVTFSHPYGAVIIAPLADDADIYHTKPKLYFVPKQEALKSFNDTSGNTLYLFEERPDEDWSTASHLGHSKKIISTENMFENILEDNDNTIDQKAYVRARLFDMIIGDWAKHEDQWRWASFKEDKKTSYVSIPRDRDNSLTKFDGTLLNMLKGMAGTKYLQTFTPKIPDVVTFNHQARYQDHHLINELTLEDWLTIANDLKKRITDADIDAAVKNLPPEVYALNGPVIGANIKSRRNGLDTYAKNYYLYLSDEVEITGSAKHELFEVKRLSDNETQIQISKITDKGNSKEPPYFSRIFNNAETKEIRLYGINGNDEYKISGQVNNSMKVRLIGGPGKDVYADESVVTNYGSTHIYDNFDNEIKKSKATHLHLSRDTMVHAYKYDYFKLDKKGISPIVFYSNEDRIYAGLAYKYQKQKWRKEPFAAQHYIDVKYSFAQNAFSSTYKSIFTEALGKWDVNLFANYDFVRWTNFFGLGNENLITTKNRDFNRVRSRQFVGKIGLQRVFNKRQRITVNPFYQSYDIINDTARYLAKTFPAVLPETYTAKQFAGAEFEYLYQNINDSILPTRGFNFLAKAYFSHNVKEKNRNLGKFGLETNVYLPLSKKISLAIKAGGATLTGKPEFYQYNIVGGNETLRGHQRDRFYGNSTAYNQNELRWISDVRSYLYNGKIGFFVLYDVGRTWLDGEKSSTWHTGYGGGIILSPFDKITLSVAYAVSTGDNNIHVKLLKAL